MLRVDLFSDPICPWCFIGKRRIESAIKTRPDLEVEIQWHSFQLNPLMPPEGMVRDEYLALKFGNPDNARRLYENIAAVGEQAGINFEFDRIQRTPNTIAAHRLIRVGTPSDMQNEIVERLFSAYFFDGKDIGEIRTLTEIAVDAGMDGDTVQAYLLSEENKDAVKSEDMQARQLGIQGVPFFILEQQFAISGAQEPEAFHPLFDLLLAQQRSAGAPGASSA